MNYGGHPQLDLGVNSMTKPLTLIGHDGARIGARGSTLYLQETGGDLNAAFSKSGLNSWVAFTGEYDPWQVAFIEFQNGDTHRIIDREVLGKNWKTCRFQLRAKTEAEFLAEA